MEQISTTTLSGSVEEMERSYPGIKLIVKDK